MQRWPEHAELWAEYAAVELQSGRAVAALPFARRVAERQPNVLQHQLQLLEALQGAGPDHRQDAQVLLQDAETRFAQKRQAFYGRGSQLLAALATHGELDPTKPQRSVLTLADGAFRVVDAMLLELTETELVVLSACQTGVGLEGMEYATLARAFAHAGVPTVVATLWRVKDRGPTPVLMEYFYKHLVQGEDRFTALAHAQRTMLKSGVDSYRTPSAWAGYIAFGKP